LADQLRQEFHAGYYDASKQRYDNGAMITSVLPLALGAVPDFERSTVVQTLLDHISAKNGTWSGGIINNRFLFDVLHDAGHGDVALRMLKRREYPSYGYMYFNDLEPAKECMWELPDAPFQGTGMNSRNHHMFSSVGHYLLTRVAGLSKAANGEFQAVVGSEPRSSVTLKTAAGDVAFSWQRSSALEVSVTVPLGRQLQLHVPVTDGTLLAASVERRGHYQLVTLLAGTHKLATSNAAWV
jgi:alpha-L-rhamnosidase